MNLFSVGIMNSETDSTGQIRRSTKIDAQGHLAMHGCFTCYEMFQRSISTFPNDPCLGERKIDQTGNAGNFEFLSYKEIGEIVSQFASGLQQRELMPPNSDGMKVLGILMKNCTNWIVAEQACFSLGAATLPIFDAFRTESIEYIVNQIGLETVLCSPQEFERVLLIAAKSSSIKTIILNCETVDENNVTLAAATAPHLRIYSWKDIVDIGRTCLLQPSPPDSKDIATLCYTSGTTGQPKGAIITHQNLIVATTGGLESGFEVDRGDAYLSFLPLPHIFERLIVTAVLSSGARVGFFRGDPLGLVEDLKALRPTLLCAVPRLLSRIRDKVVQKGSSAGGVKGYLFRTALQEKTTRLQLYGQTSHVLWDLLVFGPVKKTLGLDKVKTLLSGGAPLPSDVMAFFRVLLGPGTSCHEGYGQTETTGATTLSAKEDLATGHVGGPMPSLEIRLLDVPEMGYLHTDTEHNGRQCLGRGEVCVRGPGVFSGYYNAPAETAATFTADGWLRSGDIGLWTPQGQLVIIDRRKNLFKLSQGEYVAVERVETVLGGAPLVSQIFVHGDSSENCVVAVVVPDEDEARRWASLNGLGSGSGSGSGSGTSNDNNNNNISLSQLCASNQFRDAVMQQLTQKGKEGNLLGFEMVKAIHLESQPWLPGGDNTDGASILTPTLKLRRDVARTRYATELRKLYDELTSSRAQLNSSASMTSKL